MSEGSDQWSTTKTIATVRDAVEQAMSSQEQPPGIVEARLPLRVAIGLCLFLLTQALTLAGLYYDIRSDVRSLQESQEDLESLAAESDVGEMQARLDGLQVAISQMEEDMKTPPTSLDHMRVIGEVKADLRLLGQRLEWLERSR